MARLSLAALERDWCHSTTAEDRCDSDRRSIQACHTMPGPGCFHARQPNGECLPRFSGTAPAAVDRQEHETKSQSSSGEVIMRASNASKHFRRRQASPSQTFCWVSEGHVKRAAAWLSSFNGVDAFKLTISKSHGGPRKHPSVALASNARKQTRRS